MVKEDSPLTPGVWVPFKEKNEYILKLKLLILSEMVEIWICITGIAKLLILLIL